VIHARRGLPGAGPDAVNRVAGSDPAAGVPGLPRPPVG